MNEFITEESYNEAKKQFSDRYIYTPIAFIDITGDRIAADVLSRILYWFSPDSNGKTKLRVVKNGEYWLAKSKNEWYEELRITRKQVDRALDILEDMGLIEKAIFKFNRYPTIHVKPVYEVIKRKVDVWETNLAMEIEKGKRNEESGVSEKKDTANARNLAFSPKGAFPEKSQRGFSITKNTYNKEYSNSKVREDSNISRIDNNTLIFSNMQSMVSPQIPLERVKKRVDLNSEVEVALAIRAVLSVYGADNDSDTFRLPYILFTTFAREFKTFKGYKHKPISFDKFEKYFNKLEKFKPKKLNDETHKYEPICHTFCILEYDQDDIEDMVHDYFNQVFEDCDYSIHHFMSDSVLATRFWTIENRHAEMMAE